MVVFAAATGLRPGEWLALEWRDIDRDQQVAYVRRSLRNGRIKYPKTEASLRAVPLQARALAALDTLPCERRSTMIDRHYGHLARDGREHAINLLDAYNGSKGRRRPRGGRSVDVEGAPRR